jgi:hypothetical protein
MEFWSAVARCRNHHPQRKREVHVVGKRRLLEMRIVLGIRDRIEVVTALFRKARRIRRRIGNQMMHCHVALSKAAFAAFGHSTNSCVFV